jgi:hypothetical protein
MLLCEYRLIPFITPLCIQMDIDLSRGIVEQRNAPPRSIEFLDTIVIFGS